MKENDNHADIVSGPQGPVTMSSADLNASLTSVAKGATVVFGGLIAGNVLGMVNQIILARFMGPENYGVYNLSMSVVMIAGTVCVFGLFGSLPRFIPFHLKKKENDVVRSVIDFASLFTFTFGIILAAVTYMMSGFLAAKVFHDANLEPALKIFSIAIPLQGVHQVAQGAIRGFKAARYDALVFNIGSRIVTISVFLLSLLVIQELYGAIIAYNAGLLVTTIIGFWLIWKKLFKSYWKYRRVAVARRVLSFSWPLALSGFTLLFVAKTDKVLLGYFLTSEDVGIYTPAVVIASMLLFVSSAFKYRFLPTVSEYFSKNDVSGLEPLYKSTSRWNFIVVYPIFLFILAYPKEILTILYGADYAPGYVALIVLSFGIAMNDFAGTSANILVASGRTKLNLACEVIAAVTNVGLNVLLIPIYGIVGAAIATGASFLTKNITSLSFVYWAYRMHPYSKNYLGAIFSGLAGIAMVYAGKVYSPFSAWLTMLVLGVLFTVFYMVGAVVTRCLNRSDLVIVEAVERKTGIKLDYLKKFI